MQQPRGIEYEHAAAVHAETALSGGVHAERDMQPTFHAQPLELFGQLLREIQRLKSEGDYEAAKALVEGYGVKVDSQIHAEVKERFSKLNVAAYKGFIQPKLIPVIVGGKITDVKTMIGTFWLDKILSGQWKA